MNQLTKPTEADIQQTIRLIKKRLEHPDMAKAWNRPQREGYTEVVNILVEGRETYAGISDGLGTVQGRAIAVLGVDYLNGECTQNVLVNVPLKQQPV